MRGLDPLEEEGWGTVFRDVILLALIGFVAMVIMLLPHVQPVTKKTEEAIDAATKELIVLTNRMDAHDAELTKRTAALLVPVAKAIKNLNEQVGIQ